MFCQKSSNLRIIWVDIRNFSNVLSETFVFLECFGSELNTFLSVFFIKYDIFECFSQEINTFSMFWDKITYVPKFFAQIRYFSNVLGTNTIFQKYFGYVFDELEMISAEITYFLDILGYKPKAFKKHSVCTPKYSKVI